MSATVGRAPSSGAARCPQAPPCSLFVTALSAAGATSLAGPLGLYIARNVATVAVTVFGVVDGSRGALGTRAGLTVDSG